MTNAPVRMQLCKAAGEHSWRTSCLQIVTWHFFWDVGHAMLLAVIFASHAEHDWEHLPLLLLSLWRNREVIITGEAVAVLTSQASVVCMKSSYWVDAVISQCWMTVITHAFSWRFLSKATYCICQLVQGQMLRSSSLLKATTMPAESQTHNVRASSTL